MCVNTEGSEFVAQEALRGTHTAQVGWTWVCCSKQEKGGEGGKKTGEGYDPSSLILLKFAESRGCEAQDQIHCGDGGQTSGPS